MATQVSLNSGAVASAGALALQTNGTTEAVSISTGQVATLAQNPILTSGTANGVAYLNGSKAVTSGTALVFDGTNLGVGVTPSAWGTGSSMDVGTQTSVHYSGSVGTLFGKNVYYNAGYKYKATGTARAYVQDDGGHSWSIAASGTAGNAITFTQAMTLDASGNLGVGTTSPSYKITVKGGNANNLLVDNDGSQYTQLLMQRNSTANTGGDLLVDGTNGLMSLRMLAVGSLRFCTSASAGDGTERARIDSSGSLLVGTTGLPINNGKMAVSGISRFYQSSGDSSVSISVDKSSTTTTTSQVFVAFTINNQNTGSGQINANGASQAAFGSFSDARLKENIVDLPPQLDNIMALRPVEFDYIESEGGGHQINFIAQEFEQVYPDAIGERADGMKTLTGWGKTEARLVKAIQEQQALINQLTARITALESA